MFPLLIGLGAVAGLVATAISRATGPSRKVAAQREELERLRVKERLTIDDAEDGLVLARRFGDKKAEARFGLEVRKLRKTRVSI